MADDTSYATFLTKANADPNSGVTDESHNPHAATQQDAKRQATSDARSKYDPTTSDAGVPVPLTNLPNTQYVSDTDSDFRPVFFSYSSDTLPSQDEFRQILTKQGRDVKEIEQLSIHDFDPRGQYTEIVDRVRQVATFGGEKDRKQEHDNDNDNDSVVIFRVPGRGARVDYYILTVGDRKLVGLVAEAVES